MMLSDVQQQLIARMRACGTLRRYPGGFWSAPGVVMSDGFGGKLPPWHFSTATVRALIRMGVLAVVDTRTNPAGTFPIEVKLNEEVIQQKTG